MVNQQINDRQQRLENFLQFGGVAVAGSNRSSSDEEIDEIELLDLAEDLLEKLTEILR
jgi:hypothetical protein